MTLLTFCLDDGLPDTNEIRDYNNTPTFNREKPTLHEILMAEKSDFEAKVERAARRKKWLKGNLAYHSTWI